MRLIDADALLTERKKSKYYHLPNGDIAIPIIDVEHAPTVQPETHWIPCSERLPKEKQSVLVTDGSVVWVCDIISTDEGYKWEDSHGYWLDLNEWIAWMELPELYKEGERSE